jgi:hypothetical protein
MFRFKTYSVGFECFITISILFSCSSVVVTKLDYERSSSYTFNNFSRDSIFKACKRVVSGDYVTNLRFIGTPYKFVEIATTGDSVIQGKYMLLDSGYYLVRFRTEYQLNATKLTVSVSDLHNTPPSLHPWDSTNAASWMNQVKEIVGISK